MTLGVIIGLALVLALLFFYCGIFIAVYGSQRFICAITRHRWGMVAMIGHGVITSGEFWEIEVPTSKLEICARCGSTQLVPVVVEVPTVEL